MSSRTGFWHEEVQFLLPVIEEKGEKKMYELCTKPMIAEAVLAISNELDIHGYMIYGQIKRMIKRVKKLKNEEVL